MMLKTPIIAAGLFWMICGPVAAETAIQPLPGADCSALAAALGKALGFSLATREGPAPSYPDGLRGKACLIVGKATGLTLDFDRAQDKIAAQLAAWQHRVDLDADGPFSTSKGFANGAQRLVYHLSTEPPRGTCRENRPIADCKVPHRRWSWDFSAAAFTQ
jgi:hypothetical protein